MTKKQVIRKALTYLKNPKHWTKGNYGSENGPVCLLGGLSRAASNGKTAYPIGLFGADRAAYEAAADLVASCIPGYDPSLRTPQRTVTEYNDADEREHAEIVKTLECALERA